MSKFSLKDLGPDLGAVPVIPREAPRQQPQHRPQGGQSREQSHATAPQQRHPQPPQQPRAPHQAQRERVQPPPPTTIAATPESSGLNITKVTPVRVEPQATLASHPPQPGRSLVPTGSRFPVVADTTASFSLEDMKDILLDMGVKASHVHVALRRAAQTGEPLAQIMRDFGFLSGEGVAQAVSRQSKFEYFSNEAVDEIDKSHLKELKLTEFKRFVPVGKDTDGKLLVAVPDVSIVNEALNAFYSHKTRIVIASEHTIQTVYRKHFANTELAFDQTVAAFEKASSNRRKEEDEQSIGLVREVYFAMLRHACYSGASDLYLHRSEYIGIVRLKVNGVGQIFRTIPISLYDRVLNKLVQDNTKADDLRKSPKEAIVEFSDEDRETHSDLATRFNFRLELTESRAIRSAVIRILDRNSAATDLDKLGFDDETYKAINRISKTATGFFLVTGPTGSGKTTSLYAILKSIDAVERSVQSIEKPIEYEHGLWLQFEPRKDSTDEGEEMNEWLKALLRNAPDVILVGEVRDRSVANICLNAANTGHLVFATLHTNDAVMAVARLKSLQIDLDVLGSVLLGILAQRLLRLLCKQCKLPDASKETEDQLGQEKYLATVMKKTFKSGAGCENCDFTGYRGRRMIYELLQMTPSVREALEQGGTPSVIASRGMREDRSMWAHGMYLVADGLTSLDELQRVATRHS
jgi:type IV pilus assembly protein PilB